MGEKRGLRTTMFGGNPAPRENCVAEIVQLNQSRQGLALRPTPR